MMVGFFLDKQTPNICNILGCLDIILEKINSRAMTMHLLVVLHSPKIIHKGL